jgi:hypothetical protein
MAIRDIFKDEHDIEAPTVPAAQAVSADASVESSAPIPENRHHHHPGHIRTAEEAYSLWEDRMREGQPYFGGAETDWQDAESILEQGQ